MRKINEICRELAKELNIFLPENVKSYEGRLKMRDIMPEEEWKQSGVTCLAARPSMGKTSLAIDLVLDAARWMEKPIVFFSLETTKERLIETMLCHLNAFGGHFSWKEIPGLASAIAYLERLNIFIDDTPGISVSEIETKLQTLDGVGMVMIDYVQLVSGDDKRRKSRNSEMRWVVQSLSRISEESGTPFFILSQLTREVELRKNKRPRLDDLYMGVYPSDVKQVLFLYREDYRNRTSNNSAEIIIAKSKTGVKKTVRTKFDREHYRFEKNEGYDFVVSRRLEGTRRECGVIRGADNRVLLIGFGPDSSIYGPDDKHVSIANRIFEMYGCSVVVASNPYDRIESPMEAVEVMKEIVCDEPEIYYMENATDVLFNEKMSGGSFNDLCHVGFTRLL